MTSAIFVNPDKPIVLKAVQPVEGTKQSTWILADYTVKHADGTATAHTGEVFSCQLDGSPQTRPSGADGGFERNNTSGNTGLFHPTDAEGHEGWYVYAYVIGDGL